MRHVEHAGHALKTALYGVGAHLDMFDTGPSRIRTPQASSHKRIFVHSNAPMRAHGPSKIVFPRAYFLLPG